MASSVVTPPRHLGMINWIGLQTLINKEVTRFIKVHAQTITAPVISTVLFFLVFSIALGGNGRVIEGIPYMEFLVPGLIMMSMAQNAFANTSSSIVISKVQGNIVDVLMPPLSALELTLGYALGGVARGLCVGVASIAFLAMLVHLPITHLFFIVYHAVMGSMMLALLGVLGGIWSQKFDHLAAVQNFIVMPATFLSGTFYTIEQLPPVWQVVAHANPFYYMIDGFRYGFTGLANDYIGVGLGVMLAINIVLFVATHLMISSGYKLKS